ncbi:MAG: transcriptional regulator GcvA [Undibacterium umbellatum]|uniref:transcriptional regulator GcvA n=1 Tax=Undibacterium umbellatum TaxID=2762300 RepID=UPI003BB49AED
MNRLPPLKALQYFECTSRHLSVKNAAHELNVTPAAVSQQISKLVDLLQIPLFKKDQRGIALTVEGEHYFMGIRTAFRQMEEATRRLQEQRALPRITVSCTPGFAMQWLMPQLPQFNQLHPAIDIRISTTNRLADFARDDVDFAVRHGLGNYPGLTSEILIDDPLQPVCSPRLLKSRKQLKLVDELSAYTLLHDEHQQDWRLWLEATGAQHVPWNSGPVFADSNGALDAAKRGHGIALARKTLIREELKNHELILPFKTNIKTGIAYFLVYPSEVLLKEEARQFKDWLCRAVKLK